MEALRWGRGGQTRVLLGHQRRAWRWQLTPLCECASLKSPSGIVFCATRGLFAWRSLTRSSCTHFGPPPSLWRFISLTTFAQVSAASGVRRGGAGCGSERGGPAGVARQLRRDDPVLSPLSPASFLPSLPSSIALPYIKHRYLTYISPHKAHYTNIIRYKQTPYS